MGLRLPHAMCHGRVRCSPRRWSRCSFVALLRGRTAYLPVGVSLSFVIVLALIVLRLSHAVSRPSPLLPVGVIVSLRGCIYTVRGIPGRRNGVTTMSGLSTSYRLVCLFFSIYGCAWWRGFLGYRATALQPLVARCGLLGLAMMEILGPDPSRRAWPRPSSGTFQGRYDPPKSMLRFGLWSKALIKRECKSSQVFRKWACDDLRCHRSNVGTSRRKFWTSASGLYI